MGYYGNNNVSFSELLGKTLSRVIGDKNDHELIFETTDGERYKMYHEQDCCESVWIEDIDAPIEDLVGDPILLAEESDSDDNYDIPESQYGDGSETWTFYKLSTVKASVNIRWCGSSNGYYSESVDFIKLPRTEPYG